MGDFGSPASMVLTLLVKTHHDGDDIQELLDKTPSYMLVDTLEFSRGMLEKTKKDKKSSMIAVMEAIENQLELGKIRVKCQITTNMEAYE